MTAARACAAALLLLAAACASGPDRGEPGSARGGAGPAEPRIPPHETYVANPTELRADEVTAIFPAAWGDEIELSGLSTGFVESEPGWRTWTGTGDCRLDLRELHVRAKKLTVTLVTEQPEPEVILQAEGNVVLAHVSRKIGNLSEGIRFLHIRNDQRLER